MLAKLIRPCRSSDTSPYGSRDTIRAASMEPSVSATPDTGVDSTSCSRPGGGLVRRDRSSRSASRSQAAHRWSRSPSDSSGGCAPGQVTNTAPYTCRSVATGTAASANGYGSTTAIRG
ncbi:hypothetical protein GCM10017687_30580 [Streptomyces echinatus]